MAANRNDISVWFDKGKKTSSDFLIIVCDTFDYTDYPVFTTAEYFYEVYNKFNGQNMQKVMEVYDLSMDKEFQLNEYRAFHFPKKED